MTRTGTGRRGAGMMLALLALPAIATCQTAVTPSTAPSAPAATSSGPPAVDDAGRVAIQAVDSFDGSPEAIVRLNDALEMQGDPIPSLIPLLRDPDTTRRFGALYLVAILADSAQETDQLRPVLSDAEPAYRAMAAGALVGRGIADGIPVLIEILESDGQLPYSEPPISLADFARDTLETTTGQSFPDAGGWRTWWSQADASLRWDGTRYVAG